MCVCVCVCMCVLVCICVCERETKEKRDCVCNQTAIVSLCFPFHNLFSLFSRTVVGTGPAVELSIVCVV